MARLAQLQGRGGIEWPRFRDGILRGVHARGPERNPEPERRQVPGQTSLAIGYVDLCLNRAELLGGRRRHLFHSDDVRGPSHDVSCTCNNQAGSGVPFRVVRRSQPFQAKGNIRVDDLESGIGIDPTIEGFVAIAGFLPFSDRKPPDKAGDQAFCGKLVEPFGIPIDGHMAITWTWFLLIESALNDELGIAHAEGE